MTITVTRTGSAVGEVSVDYATSDGSALAPSDYTATNGTLIFPDGSSAPRTFTIPISNDSFVEPDETVTLTLSNPTGDARLGAASTAVLTITDDDSALQFSASSYRVNESENAVITVNRVGALVNPATVAYSTRQGTATAGRDYTDVSGALSFAPGESSKTFVVPVIDDRRNEGNETVRLRITGASGATLGSPNKATLRIIDND